MRKSRRDRLVVQLDGAIHQLERRHARQLREPAEGRGDKWFFTDFGGAEPRILQVESPPRYAHFVIRRRLTETGEMDASDHVLIHCRRKRGPTTTEALFTPVAADTYQDALNAADEDKGQHLVFPLSELLLTALRRYAPRETAAVVFQHDRHVDLLVGRNGEPLRAARLSAYSAEALDALAQSVRAELENIQAETRLHIQRIIHFGWAETGARGGLSAGAFGGEESGETTSTHTGIGHSFGVRVADHQLENVLGSEWVRVLARDLEIACQVLPPRRYEMEGGGSVVTSLAAVAEQLPLSRSVSPPVHLWAYRAQRAAPWAAFLSWAGVAALFGATVWLGAQTGLLHAELDRVAVAGVEEERRAIPRLPETHAPLVEFIGDLAAVSRAPSVRDILADLSYAHRDPIEIGSVAADFSDPARPTVRLTGRIDAAFDTASARHREFVTALETVGYRVVESEFDTRVDRLSFSLALRRERE